MKRKIPTTTPSDIDIEYHVHQFLAKHHKIAVIWSTKDVRGVRPDLSEDQAWAVLQEVEDQHDANFGIGWTTIEIIAGFLYDAPSRKEE